MNDWPKFLETICGSIVANDLFAVFYADPARSAGGGGGDDIGMVRLSRGMGLTTKHFNEMRKQRFNMDLTKPFLYSLDVHWGLVFEKERSRRRKIGKGMNALLLKAHGFKSKCRVGVDCVFQSFEGLRGALCGEIGT